MPEKPAPMTITSWSDWPLVIPTPPSSRGPTLAEPVRDRLTRRGSERRRGQPVGAPGPHTLFPRSGALHASVQSRATPQLRGQHSTASMRAEHQRGGTEVRAADAVGPNPLRLGRLVG